MAIPERISQTPPPSQTQSAPVQPPVSKPADPVRELIEIQRTNQALLKQTAENSELILATMKSERRNKLIGVLLKYSLYGLIAYWSFAMIPKLTQQITQQMMGNITSGIGGGDLGQSVDPENIQGILENLDLNAILSN